MEKLQPFIKHHYWICFGLSVIFVVVGWWMASRAIATETDIRQKAVKDSFEKAKQGATDPNQHWVAAAKERNAQDDVAYKSASKRLWERQQNARKWPEMLQNDMKGIGYKDPIANKTTRGKWAQNYRTQMEKLLEIVKPFKPENGEGLVMVDPSRITHKPYESWKYGLPASAEMWNNQEDIWLLQSLLTSIARVNEGATRITESHVRQIFRLTLRGGDRDAKAGGTGGAGGMGMGGMGMGGGEGGMGMGGMGMGGGEGGIGMGGMSGAAGGAGGAGHPGKEFEGSAGSDILTEEFGAFASASGGGLGRSGMGSSGMGSSGMGGEGGSGGGGMGMGMGMGSGAGAKAAEERRYVDGDDDDDDKLEYRTRAFLLDVLVRDEQLPNLLASLTNSDFPVEIVRVEITSKPSSGAAGGMSGGLGGEMSGSEMGGSSMGGMGMGMSMGGRSLGGGGGGGGSGAGSMNMGAPPSFGGGIGSGMSGDDGAMLGEDMGSAGIGGGIGFGTDSGVPGMGSGSGGGNLAASRGQEALRAAMADPLLISVKIGGLMTLYQSAEESKSEEATEAAAVTEQSAIPATPPTTDVDAAASTDTATPANAAASSGAAATDPNAAAGSGDAATTPVAAGALAPPTGGTENATGGEASATDPSGGVTPPETNPGNAAPGDPAAGTPENPASSPGTPDPPAGENPPGA